jgi:pimeloyl-ACP methyl ester carboxylesterase
MGFVGRIYHRNGSPAANATVEMYGTDNATTTTDSSGTYHFNVPTDDCSVKYHCVSFKASIADPSCEPAHVRPDNGEGWSIFCWCGNQGGGENTVGGLTLGSCPNGGGGSPAPTPPPSDDKNVKPFPFPSPVPTDSGFYGIAPDDAFTHTVPRSGGPVLRNVDVTRVVGELRPEDGTLKYAGELVNNGVVGRYATLKIPAYDVDSDAGERDHVLFNGVEIGPEGSKAYLAGKDKSWFISEFQVPIELVRFGNRNPGNPPDPGHNEVKILVDESNGGPERWRVSVGAPKIEFQALYPVVMVHGNNSCGNYFAGDWDCDGQAEPADQWFIRAFMDQRIPFDNSITMPTDTIRQHAAWLLESQRSIKVIAAEWGARHVHLIAHSKGGLDVRAFLARLPSGDSPGELGVYSLTTLSSPHLGSVGADYQDSVSKVSKTGLLLSDNRFRAILAASMGTDPGKYDLRVDSVARFNKRNIPALPRSFKVDGKANEMSYFTIAADANLDGSEAPNSVVEKFHPEKYKPTITDGTSGTLDETHGLPYIPYVQGVTSKGKGWLYTQVYVMFGTVHEAVLEDRLVPGVLFPRVTKAVKEVPEPCWFLPSDFAVTWASSVADDNPCRLVLGGELPPANSLLPLRGSELILANHATLSSITTANKVIDWIRLAQPLTPTE